MAKMKNNKRTTVSVKDGMDGGQVQDGLDSDNSYSDKGLNNDELTRKAVSKSNP